MNIRRTTPSSERNAVPSLGARIAKPCGPIARPASEIADDGRKSDPPEQARRRQADATMTTRLSIGSEFGKEPDLQLARYSRLALDVPDADPAAGALSLGSLAVVARLGPWSVLWAVTGAGEPGCSMIQPGGSLAGNDSRLASSTESLTASSAAVLAGSRSSRLELMRYPACGYAGVIRRHPLDPGVAAHPGARPPAAGAPRP